MKANSGLYKAFLKSNRCNKMMNFQSHDKVLSVFINLVNR